MHAYSIHRDPRNFSKPDTFWPERWLLAASPDSTAAAAQEGLNFVHDAQAFIPFSHGPMNCVGRALGLVELRAVLCALVRRFDFRLVGVGEGAGAGAPETTPAFPRGAPTGLDATSGSFPFATSLNVSGCA